MAVNPDHINAAFEAGAAILLSLNVWQLYHDKKVSGVKVSPTVFLTVWGGWNLYYYPSLGQDWSFFAGIAVVTVNAVWVSLAIFFNRKNRGGSAHVYALDERSKHMRDYLDLIEMSQRPPFPIQTRSIKASKGRAHIDDDG